MDKKKINGEVFTPSNIIDYMVNENYSPNDVDYVLEPGCGDGRFIIKMIEKIIQYYNYEYSVINQKINKIYGIELDFDNFNKANTNINNFLLNYPQITTKPNIINGDALIDLPKNIEWDLIIGNPPYVRIHNLPSSYLNILKKEYRYLNEGMVDLYYGFFELHKKLSKKGMLCYITPSSYLYNSSGKSLLDDLYKNKLIKSIKDFDSLKMFEQVSTYTCITTLTKNNDLFEYILLNSDFTTQKLTKVFYKEDEFLFSSIKQSNNSGKIKFSEKYKVKTGFATLCDKVFILKDYVEDDELITFIKKNVTYTIEKGLTKKCVKASKFDGNLHRVIFPYENVNGVNKPLSEENLANNFPMGYEYLKNNKKILLSRDKGKIDEKKWFLWGRTQCINNNEGPKIIISPMFSNSPFLYVNEDVLVYSGYFIISETFDEIFKSHEFIENLKNISKPMANGWKSLQKKIIDEVFI